MTKNLIFAILLTTISFAGCQSEDNDETPREETQVTLYDQNKTCALPILYTFEGEPVAYIESKEQVYSFNAKLLGWYVDGVLYDRTYHAVGAKHGIVRGGINTVVTRLEKIKGVKHIKPEKPVKGNDFIHPVLKDSWSETTLTEFFADGKK